MCGGGGGGGDSDESPADVQHAAMNRCFAVVGGDGVGRCFGERGGESR